MKFNLWFNVLDLHGGNNLPEDSGGPKILAPPPSQKQSFGAPANHINYQNAREARPQN